MIKTLQEVGLGAKCGGSSSLLLDGSILNNNDSDSLTSNTGKIALYDYMTSCLTKMTKEMNNQTKQQADAIMIQFLDHQTQIEMAKKHSGANKRSSSNNCDGM